MSLNKTNQDKLSLSNAARLINRHPKTVRRWYDWYEHYYVPSGVYLPPRHKLVQNGGWYILACDLKYLQEFSKSIKRGGKWYGVMSDYNALNQWTQDVSDRVLGHKNMTKLDVRRQIHYDD